VASCRKIVAACETRARRGPAVCAAPLRPASSPDITERSRTAVKGLTVMHDDAVDKKTLADKREIIAASA
jgi:hypothetical protein